MVGLYIYIYKHFYILFAGLIFRIPLYEFAYIYASNNTILKRKKKRV
jgi:hypothetical protein